MSVIVAQRSIKHYDKQWFVVHMEKQIKMRTRCKQAVYSKVMLILFKKLSDKRFIVSCETRLIVRLCLARKLIDVLRPSLLQNQWYNLNNNCKADINRLWARLKEVDQMAAIFLGSSNMNNIELDYRAEVVQYWNWSAAWSIGWRPACRLMISDHRL